MIEETEYDFELDLNFQGNKNPIEAFSQLAKMYEKLIELDRNIIYNILPTANINYELVDNEIGSIKSKVFQFIKSVPDDLLKDVLNPSAWLGQLLIYVKYRFKGSRNQGSSIKELYEQYI